MAVASVPWVCFCVTQRITGLVAAVYTPFNDDMELDVSVVPSQAKYLNDTGVHHILVAGTTGESVKLTVAERKELAEAWAKAAPAYGIKIYVHIAANALADARELARHAESISADGLVAMSTTYFRPSTVDALVTELQYMFSAAPSLPAWYYHIPSMTGDNNFKGFDMHDFLVANQGDGGAAKIPNLVGVKFTGEAAAASPPPVGCPVYGPVCILSWPPRLVCSRARRL